MDIKNRLKTLKTWEMFKYLLRKLDFLINVQVFNAFKLMERAYEMFCLM